MYTFVHNVHCNADQEWPNDVIHSSTPYSRSSPGSKAVGEEVPMDANPAYGEVHIYDSIEEQKGDYYNL